MSETTWRLAPAEATEEMAVRAFQTVDLALAAVEMGPCDQYRYVYRASLSAAPKPPAGLYEAREDGSVRLIETDVANALEACMQDTLFYAEQVCEPGSQGRAEGWQRIEQARAALRALTGEER